MRTVVVGVFDTAAGAFGRPIFVGSVGLAIRSFSDEVNRQAQDNQMYAHPEDFTLWELGTFDEETGKFELLADRKLLTTGKNVSLNVTEASVLRGNGQGGVHVPQ